MIQLRSFERFEELQQYIQEHIGELMNDAIEEFNKSNGYSKPLEYRFRLLRPYANYMATYYLDEIENVKPKVKKG